jgi:hypothetical protein
MADARSDLNPEEIRRSSEPVPPGVVEQALRAFDEQATVEEVRRLRESGGLALSDFYGELEQLVRSRE